MSDLPFVSVVIPTRDRPDLLGQAYVSLRNQTYLDFELVLSVNGRHAASLPQVRKIEASDPRVQVLYNPDYNLSEAWNAGFRASRGEVLHFLADDDLLEPRFLESAVTAFLAHPDLGLVGTDYVAFTSDMREVAMPCMLTNPGAAAAGTGSPAMGAFNLNVSLFRRNLLDHMVVGDGPFDPTFRTRGDEDLFARISKSGTRALHICSPLMRYRVHPGQATQGMDARHFFEHLRIVNSINPLGFRDALAQTVWMANRRMGLLGTRIMKNLGRGTAYRLSAVERLMYPDLGR